MHWCIVSVRINRLYGTLQRQTNTRGEHKCGERRPWTCQIKRAPSWCVRHERSSKSSLLSCHQQQVRIQAETHPRLKTFLYFLGVCWLSAWRHANRPTNTHTQNLKSSLNAKYSGWPAWQRLSAKTHYGGEWMIICTIQCSALQHWHLCKTIPPLSKHRIKPVLFLFSFTSWCK